MLLEDPLCIGKTIGHPPVSTDEVVGFLARRGSRPVHAGGCWWYNDYGQTRVYHSFPPHRLVEPSPVELRQVFQAAPKALLLRYPGPPNGLGRPSYMLVRREPYDLRSLDQKARNQTRRGLEQCVVRHISWEELVAHGWEAHRDTVVRHGEAPPQSLGLDAGLAECPAYESWGAFVGGGMAGYIVALCVEDWAHILVHRSANAYLAARPNNALTYTVTQELLARPHLSAVNYGWESLASHDSLDSFKIGMGYAKEPVRQHAVPRPWLRPFLQPATCRLVEVVAARRPNDGKIQKLVGLLRLVGCG